MATMNNVKLDKAVEIYPSKTVGNISTSLEVKSFWLTPEQAQAFVKELVDLGCIKLIEETLQGLSKRTDGTPLKTAFPTLIEFEVVAKKVTSLPSEFFVNLQEWSTQGATEVNLDFEEK
ncbi:hypothetical protein ACMAZF_20200 (plasmid) [Psychrobium sp. nBUS_13]|uniref:hypothetical protein n=1 Tax=Psychrobium sp. nBUS_13 TaxID=3395319 RepID=UPI003EBF7083